MGSMSSRNSGFVAATCIGSTALSKFFCGDYQERDLGRPEASKVLRQLSFKLVHVLADVMDACWKCIGDHSEMVLCSQSFLRLSLQSIIELLMRPSLRIPEVVIFRAVHRWTQNQCETLGLKADPVNKRKILGDTVLRLLNFPGMTEQQLEWEVIPSGLLEYKDVGPLFQWKRDPTSHMMPRFKDIRGEICEETDLPEVQGRPSVEPLRPTSALKRNPQADDEIDALLSAAILQRELRQQVACQDFSKPTGMLTLRDSFGPPTVVKSRGNVPRAQDFERLSPGLYRFQGSQILRMRLENGEVMVYQMAGSASQGCGAESFLRSTSRARGVSLQEFLG